MILASLQVGQDKYVILFDDQTHEEALRTLGRWASREDLNFDWKDAAVLAMAIHGIRLSP